MSLSCRTNSGPMRLSGGLSNITRQWAGESRFSRIGAVFVDGFMKEPQCVHKRDSLKSHCNTILRRAKPRESSACDSHVFSHAAAACADGPDHGAVEFDWNSTAEDHDFGIIGRIKSEALLAALRYASQVLGGGVKRQCGPSLVDRDIDAPEPSPIHAHVRHQTTARIDYGDVVRDTHFDRLALPGCDDATRIGEVQRKDWSRHVVLLDRGCIYEITVI